MKTIRLLAALCLGLWLDPVLAQTHGNFPATGGGTVQGSVQMCWNGTLAVPCGVPQVSLDGALSVNTPPNPEFTDLFSTALDTTTNWTTNNSGGTTATASGSLVISGTTTLSQYGGLSTKQSWTPAGISPQIFGVVAVYNTIAVTNSVRIFGVYTSPGTPTLAAPITDGYVFRIDATGALFAEVWAAGTAVASSNITAVTGCAPVAGTPNLYYVSFRTNLVQFGCGNNPSAFITVLNPVNQTLPISAYSIAGLSNPGSAATMTLTGLSLSSQSGASVKSAGQAPTVNDSATVVTISPNSPGSGGGAVFGPTASGSASANPPVQIGGTVTGAAGANVSGAAVKAASTAAAATDTSLVTQLNPNSPGIIALGPVAAASSIPTTIGPAVLGSYCVGLTSGTIAAGLAGGSPVYAFRYGGANLAIVRKLTISVDDVTTAFVAGSAKFDLFAARSFTASDTGGTSATLTGNNGKLRTSYATTAVSNIQIASTGTMTAGTRTLDASALASMAYSVSTSIDAALVNPGTVLYDAKVAEMPMQWATNEGFVIQATVPGTGTWFFSGTVCWDEVSAF